MANANRKAWVPDEKQLQQITQLAAQGLTVKQVAASIGIGATTFFERQKVMPELKEAIEAGRAKGIATITNALFQKAKNGDNTAMIFYLKNRDRDSWGERPPAADDDAQPLQITINTVDASVSSKP